MYMIAVQSTPNMIEAETKVFCGDIEVVPCDARLARRFWDPATLPVALNLTLAQPRSGRCDGHHKAGDSAPAAYRPNSSLR